MLVQIDETSAMFKGFAEAAREKEVKKAADLTLKERYRIERIITADGKYGTVIIVETKNFLYYLPQKYSNAMVSTSKIKENYEFSVDKLFLLKNGHHSAKISFYLDGKKLE